MPTSRKAICIKFYMCFIIVVFKYYYNILSCLLFTQIINIAINTYDSPVGSIRRNPRQGCFRFGQRVRLNLTEV